MSRYILAATAALGVLAFFPSHGRAAMCADGVYRAGCAGPNGAAVVRKPVARPPTTVTCANGVYHAGCAGPNGAAVVRKPVARPPTTVTCANGVYHAGCAGPNGAAVVRKY